MIDVLGLGFPAWDLGQKLVSPLSVGLSKGRLVVFNGYEIVPICSALVNTFVISSVSIHRVVKSVSWHFLLIFAWPIWVRHLNQPPSSQDIDLSLLVVGKRVKLVPIIIVSPSPCRGIVPIWLYRVHAWELLPKPTIIFVVKNTFASWLSVVNQRIILLVLSWGHALLLSLLEDWDRLVTDERFVLLWKFIFD